MSRQYLYQPSTLRVDLDLTSDQVPDVKPGNRLKLTEVAQDVAIERGVTVCETLFHIAAIRSLLPPRKGMTRDAVTCRGAESQLTRGTDGQVAAHLLPGAIFVNNRPVRSLVNQRGMRGEEAHQRERLSLQLGMCFARTIILPKIFNDADSQAEKMAIASGTEGLKPLFGGIVETLWNGSWVKPGQALEINREAVLSAISTWFNKVNAIYRAASLRKDTRALEVNSAKDRREREAEARVLEVYAESFVVANVARFIDSNVPTLRERYPTMQ